MAAVLGAHLAGGAGGASGSSAADGGATGAGRQLGGLGHGRGRRDLIGAERRGRHDRQAEAGERGHQGVASH